MREANEVHNSFIFLFLSYYGEMFSLFFDIMSRERERERRVVCSGLCVEEEGGEKARVSGEVE